MSTLIVFFALLLLAPPSTSTAPLPSSCIATLTSISPCLPYISSPPNNLSASPSSQCCDLYSAFFLNQTASCVCYLLSEHSLFGFPLNVTRIESLSSLCPGNGDAARDLESLCRATPPTLPPSEATPPAGFEYSPKPSLTSSLKPPASSPMPATPSSGPTANSPTAKPAKSCGCHFLPPLIVYMLLGILVLM